MTAAGPRAERELEQLTRRKQQDFPGSTLNLWDRQYYSELVRRASGEPLNPAHFKAHLERRYLA